MESLHPLDPLFELVELRHGIVPGDALDHPPGALVRLGTLVPLDEEPVAQKIFEEAMKAIREAVCETKRECPTQVQDVAVGVAQTQKNVEDMAHTLRMTQVGSPTPPGIPKQVAVDRRNHGQFIN